MKGENRDNMVKTPCIKAIGYIALFEAKNIKNFYTM